MRAQGKILMLRKKGKSILTNRLSYNHNTRILLLASIFVGLIAQTDCYAVMSFGH